MQGIAKLLANSNTGKPVVKVVHFLLY
ncbi:hypothetical protein Pint_10840 [Pistacia integerrima]|uniref:Uncharacterized protein n=1 Tax=Pistacia integerrima TaxID=434235 RepID=A0ACC0XHH7_9ROSI|nr:hypothetical protein Pint_10840 [Pistacia integerrima]